MMNVEVEVRMTTVQMASVIPDQFSHGRRSEELKSDTKTRRVDDKSLMLQKKRKNKEKILGKEKGSPCKT